MGGRKELKPTAGTTVTITVRCIALMVHTVWDGLL